MFIFSLQEKVTDHLALLAQNRKIQGELGREDSKRVVAGDKKSQGRAMGNHRTQENHENQKNHENQRNHENQKNQESKKNYKNFQSKNICTR